MNDRDTRHYVRRYLLSLKNIGEKEPEKYPFMDLMKGPQPDYSPDPFDALEMIRSSGTSSKPAGTPARPQ